MADTGPQQQPMVRDAEEQTSSRWARELAETNDNQDRFLHAYLETKLSIDDVIKLRRTFADEIRDWQQERAEEKRAFCRALKEKDGETIIEP
eukprot:gene134-5786_t